MTTCLVASGPEHMGAAALKARQHDPKGIACRQLHEALQAEPGDG